MRAVERLELPLQSLTDMDDSLYDEFGNYIGPELSGSEEVRLVSDEPAFSCLKRWLLGHVASLCPASKCTVKSCENLSVS